MASVRFDPALQKKLARAVKVSGLSASEIIRDAVEERVSILLGDTAAARLAPFIGKVASGKRVSARNHKGEFAQIMAEKDARRRRRAAG